MLATDTDLLIQLDQRPVWDKTTESCPAGGRGLLRGRGFFHSLGRNKPSENHQTNGRFRRILALGARVRLGPLFHPERPLVIAVFGGRSCPLRDVAGDS